jgi:phage gpG-like protein
MIEVEFDAQALQDALLGQAESFRDALETRIQQKLSGEVLQARSGALAGSIFSSIENNESETTISLSSSGVPYAAIQEFGGKTAAHEIVAVNAKVLAFRAGGDLVFRRRVDHPGSAIPARSYLRGSLTDMRDEIELGLKQAILEALGEA